MNEIPSVFTLPWGPSWTCGRARIDGDQIALEPNTLERFDLYERDRHARLEGRPELAFALEAVKTPLDACAVVRRYGLLLRGPESEVFSEPFSLWETVAGQRRSRRSPRQADPGARSACLAFRLPLEVALSHPNNMELMETHDLETQLLRFIAAHGPRGGPDPALTYRVL